MKTTRGILSGLCTLLVPAMVLSEESNPAPDRTQWFREARFGMFIHWGVYAVPAGEWEGQTIKGIGEWIMRFRKIPVEKYKSYAPGFTAANYDPEAWAELAHKAGMRYLVITSKHHDGFALYDSAFSDWDVMASGAQRDLLAPLAKAVRARDMKFGLYYSQSQDWTHPGGAPAGLGKGWDPAQNGDYDGYLKSIALPQAREIIDRYKPAILWWDTPYEMTPERVAPFAELMAKHPDIINNNRLGEGFEGDTSTPEQHIPPRGFPGRMFEVCMTMNDTWGYKVNDRNWKSSQRLIRMLSDIASKGGNLLLNIGPRADGTIPQESIDRLEAIGRWMDVNSEAIHATEASPFPRRLPWGRVTRKPAENGGTTLYLHVWDWPADGRILLPTLRELPSSGAMLEGGAAVTAGRTVDGIVVHLPGQATDPDVSVARLEFPGTLTVTQQPFATPDAGGTITLLALDADPHGAVGGNIHVEGTGAEAYLTNWKIPSYRVEYRVKTGKAGKWKVAAELAANRPAVLHLNAGESTRPIHIPATGDGPAWKILPLGEIELPEDEAVIELKPDPENWNPIQLRKLTLTPVAANGHESTLSLAGEWRFQLDAGQAGIAGKWHAKTLTDTIRLPGTTDENEKGILTHYRPVDRLARVWDWKGPAWYQRDITIPESWQGKRITLFLERTKHSRLWVNDTFVSWDDSLSAPHIFDITAAVSPGTHTLTLLIDNSKLPPVGPSHAVDERTQTNWNGIAGRIELHATDPVWIEDVQVFPNAARREARVVAAIGNITGKPVAGTLVVNCTSRNVESPATFATHNVTVTAAVGESTVEFIYQPGPDVPLWDEFNPALLDLELKLAAATFADARTVTFGMRDFTRQGNRLLVNGRPVFLRGRVDCANYPLSGYAPMDRESWQRILQIQKDWGLNHIRFHSWCPPAAAFEVADELGFYLQAELPNKRSAFNAPDEANAAIHNYDFLNVNASDDEVPLFDYGRREGELIFRRFGNSPSFVMFTLGNELGMNDGMAELVAHFKTTNPRALHAQGSNNMHWEPTLPEDDDFWVIAKIDKMTKPVRGAFHIHRNPPGHIENHPPSTLVDYRESIAGVPVPVIGHETGAYQVSPDFNEIGKFTGVLRARNYETFRDRLENAGMLDQADDFVKASGALAAICYREEIEAALRTPEFGGFQLLDIMDFPGQGTAPVGMLNVFMENKGILQPVQWREFCSETVPLLGMEKYTWTTDETFEAGISVAHYGPTDLKDAWITTSTRNSEGHRLADSSFHTGGISTGGIKSTTGKWSFAFAGFPAPQKIILTVGIKDTPYHNSYPVWLYPAEIDTDPPQNILVSRALSDDHTRSHLQNGGRVLLMPELKKLPHSVPGAFMTDYWSPMFAQGDRKRGETPPPGTMGILCDPAHPAFAAFPTESHSHWQWWHLVKTARPIVLDETPHDYRPILQVIDNFDRYHKLGLVFETRVGKGSLLVCAIDLPALQDKPEARQLLHSLQQYAASASFNPKHRIDTAILNKLLP